MCHKILTSADLKWSTLEPAGRRRFSTATAGYALATRELEVLAADGVQVLETGHRKLDRRAFSPQTQRLLRLFKCLAFTCTTSCVQLGGQKRASESIEKHALFQWPR